MLSIFCCSASPPSLCDFTSSWPKILGESFFERLFGKPTFQASGILGMRVLRPFNGEGHVRTHGAFPPRRPRRRATRSSPKHQRRLKKSPSLKARSPKRRRSWSLFQKIYVRKTQREMVPPKVLKRQTSMRSIRPPRDTIHTSHYNTDTGLEMVLPSSSLDIDEIYESGLERLREEYNAAMANYEPLARTPTERSIASTIYYDSLTSSSLDKDNAIVSPQKHNLISFPSPTESPLSSRPGSSSSTDQQMRPTSPMSKRKPVPYHILDDLDFSQFRSFRSQPPGKVA